MNKQNGNVKRRFSLFKSFKLENKTKSDLNETNENSLIKRADLRSLSFKLVRNKEPNKELFKKVNTLSPYYGIDSNGCIISGPYKSIVISKDDDISEMSFESTRITHTDSIESLNEEFTLPSSNHVFKNTEIVWAKQILFPWFPGIIINPNEINKKIKDLLKDIGAPLPSQQDLDSKEDVYLNNKDAEKIYFVFLFNKKKSWIWLPNTKLRPFCKENNVLFSEGSQVLSSKYCKELKKAFEKARKINDTNNSKKKS